MSCVAYYRFEAIIDLAALRDQRPPPAAGVAKVRAPAGRTTCCSRSSARRPPLCVQEAHCPDSGVLGILDGHLHEPRRRLHAYLRLLCDHHGARSGDRTNPNASVAPSPISARYVVITSVNRDDLSAAAPPLAATIRAVRRQAPACRVEVADPYFQARRLAPDGHRRAPNVRTITPDVPRLYSFAPRRPLRRTLDLSVTPAR